MLGKRTRPAIGKLAGVLRSGIMDTLTSPRSPLDYRALRSPRKLKSYYCDQGVGLGIVVALDNTSSNNCNVRSGGEVLVKYAICSQFSSLPINIGPSNKHNYEKINNKHNYNKSIKEHDNIIEEGFEEDFTYVTYHGPNKSATRVYYGGGEYGLHHESIRPTLTEKIGVFNISSPVRFSNDHNHLYGSDSDFLSSCHLCRKGLQGKDIYMYRGEKAFCSAECRQRQIRMDERKEQCISDASRSSEVSSSPYSYNTTPIDQIFFTGIVAA